MSDLELTLEIRRELDRQTDVLRDILAAIRKLTAIADIRAGAQALNIDTRTARRDWLPLTSDHGVCSFCCVPSFVASGRDAKSKICEPCARRLAGWMSAYAKAPPQGGG